VTEAELVAGLGLSLESFCFCEFDFHIIQPSSLNNYLLICYREGILLVNALADKGCDHSGCDSQD
jgi:hypothetical protein